MQMRCGARFYARQKRVQTHIIRQWQQSVHIALCRCMYLHIKHTFYFFILLCGSRSLVPSEQLFTPTESVIYVRTHLIEAHVLGCCWWRCASIHFLMIFHSR